MNVLYPVEYNSFYRLVERICFEVHMRISKSLFEKMVKACYKLLDLRNVDASIDGTGFSNTNPSHYYCDRIDGKTVRNYTKTVFLADNKSKLILNIRTKSDHANETLDFIQRQ